MKLLSVFGDVSCEVVVTDAESLITALGNGAYEVARTRAREQRLGQIIEANRPDGHWDRARKEIARRTRRRMHVDSATRYLDF